MYGREVLVDRVLRPGWSVAAAAKALQVSRQSGYPRLWALLDSAGQPLWLGDTRTINVV